MTVDGAIRDPAQRTVQDLLRAAADRRPDAVLTWEDGSTRRYSELLAASERCATALAELGVVQGDRVAFWLPNSWAYLDFLLGTLQLGAVAVAVNTRYRASEVGHILAHTKPRVLVVTPGFRDIPFGQMLSDMDPRVLSSIEAVLHCDKTDALDIAALRGCTMADHAWALRKPRSEARPNGEDDAVIFTTSGTTSGPKFAVHRHSAIAGHAVDAAGAFGYDHADARLLHALPFCGIYGFSQWTATLAAGATSVFMTMFDAPTAAQLMTAHGITHTSGTDDLLKRLLESGKGPRPFPQLRECVYAGFNPTLAQFPEQAEARGMRLIGCFGMSEIHSFFSRQESRLSVDERKRPGGMPISAQTVVRTRDLGTGELLADDSVGLLEIRSPHLFVRYDNQAEATRAAFTDDGFFRTGDLARVLPDGRYEFMGRQGDFMRLGGFLVNPLDIELEIQLAPGVETAIVVEGVAETGSKAVAFIRLAPGAPWDEAALRQHCVSRIANFKVPALFVQVDAFPTAAGPNGEKVQRVRLKADAASLLAQGHS